MTDQLTIKPVEIDRLIPYVRNARTHSEEQIAQIAASIVEFGFTNPVLIDSKEGIIAGHGRVLAARKLGLDSVPCVELPHLTDIQKRAYIIADNKLALNAGWDEELLKLELEALNVSDFDLELTGFSEDELSDILADEVNEGLTEDDAVPPLPELPITVLGDVWILGNHRLMCGDSVAIDQVETLMANQKADMVFTDPPYNVDYNPDTRPIGGRRRTVNKLGGIKNDKMSAENFLQFLRDVFASMVLVSKEGAAVYICHPDLQYGLSFRQAFQETYKLSSVLIWVKNNFSIGRSDYHWMHEPILYGWRKDATHTWYGDRSQTTIWHIKRDSGNDYVHPTQKPVELIERALLNSSKADDAILDLFGGSGSTLIACEKLNRQARLMELDPKFCDVIIHRWQNWANKPAMLESNGCTFQEVKEARLKT